MRALMHSGAVAALLLIAQRLGEAAEEVYAMRDVRTCQGFEKSYAACDDLPPCEAACEPQDCAFGAWSTWYDAGGCSGLCHRQRNVDTVNNECGTPCLGPKIESKSCLKSECTLKSEDCTLSPWSDWSGCSSEVDQRYRYRQLMKPPEGEGAPCTGHLNETVPCEAHPVDCVFSEWGQWTECSVSCGGGYHAAVRTVVQRARHGGQLCEGTTRLTKPCNEQPCVSEVQDCRLGEWSDWEGCNFASPQQQYRTRDVAAPAIGAGMACSDAMKQTAGCRKEKKPQDCKLSEWTAWADCDKSCGGGQTYRKRSLLEHPEHGGTCGNRSTLTETAACNGHSCDAPVSCALSHWSDWSQCSASCDMGVMGRKREMLHGVPQRRLTLVDMFANSMAMVSENMAQIMDCSAGFNGSLQEVRPCDARPCVRQDCIWAQWAEWSACTCSCGGGTKRRSRVVETPPGIGGKLCEPEDKSEIGTCNTQPCELCIDGSWGLWSEWTSCSATCGSGLRSRHRDVMQHPNQCGKPVSGVQDDFESCEGTASCVPDVDCTLTSWTSWSDCSGECYGVTERHRSIATTASGKGKQCSQEQLKEVEMCNPHVGGVPPPGCGDVKKPSPCRLAEWSEWGTCSQTCGGGQQTRLRHVLSPASDNGEQCNGTLSETTSCSLEACPHAECVDCSYGEWSEWGACSKCGGQRYRHRSIAQMPNECGKPCSVAETKQTGECTSECEEERWCSWSEWSEYSSCSSECGPAIKTRQRQLAMFEAPPKDYLFSGSPGMTCAGDQLDSMACPFKSCDEECTPTDCVFAGWSEWSDPTCSQLCERTRAIQVPSSCGGATCGGSLVETKRCHHQCEKVEHCVFSNWEEWSACESSQGQTFRKRTILQAAKHGGTPCEGELSETRFCSNPGLPEPCELSNWVEWSKCTKSCYGGLKQRTRAVSKPAAKGGAPCDGTLEELAICNDGPCAGEQRACTVGPWEDWSSCGADAQRYRQRAVNQPSNGGAPCEANLQEIQMCSTTVDCVVSEWSTWDECDKTCDGGQQQRQRQVSQNQRNGGKACPPELMETRGCNRSPCNKVDCVVSEWTTWGTCSATCGIGQHHRSRKIVQQPQDGGTGCGLELSQLRSCTEGECEYIDCKWSDWSDWSDCSCPCDGGQRTRTRRIEQAPQKGGKPCVPLDKEEISVCNTQKCTNEKCVDGAWGEWEEWEKCSSTCEGGVTWRSRMVAREANHCGMPATGSMRESRRCNEEVPCEPDVDCALRSWGEWSDCTANCKGVKRRERAVNVHGRGQGKFCMGSLKETSPCNPGPGEEEPQACAGAPPEDCVLGEWTKWSTCSADCGGGSQTREREVIKGPANGGKACDTTLSEVTGCNRAPCSRACEPVDCVWEDWGEWSACDKCGGQMKRFRHVVKEAHCGGSQCEAAASEETTNCTRQCHEPAYCMWGDWKEWSACSATCGTGAERSRARRLMLTSSPPMRFLEDASELDEMFLHDRLQVLKKQTTSMRTRRLQELIAAFAGGGVALVASLAVIRFSSRNHAHREFSRLPRDIQTSPEES